MFNRLISTLFFVIILFTNFLGASPAEVQFLSDDTAHRLKDNEVRELWARVDVAPATRGRVATNANPFLVQMKATIEVLNAGSNVAVTFSMLEEVSDNSYILYRLILPNGTPVPLSGYAISGGRWAAYLWDGKFSGVWPAGDNLFEVFVINGVDGTLSYISAYVPVYSCCSMLGPITRATVSDDGATIEITGSLGNDTIATLNGEQVQVFLTFSPTTGQMTGKIRTGYAEGQSTLVLVSGGVSSTRVLYITHLPTFVSQPSNQ